jgi:hypothetical protein
MVQQLASSNMPTGSVIQVVSSTVNTNASTTSTSFVTTGISVSITPKFSNSKVLLRFAGGQMDVGNGRQQMSLTFYRNSTNLAPSGGAQNYGFCCILLTGPSSFELQVPAAMEYLDSPATTSAITYSVYFISNSGGTVYLSTNGNSMTLTAQEIAG